MTSKHLLPWTEPRYSQHVYLYVCVVYCKMRMQRNAEMWPSSERKGKHVNVLHRSHRVTRVRQGIDDDDVQLAYSTEELLVRGKREEGGVLEGLIDR